MTRNPGDPAYDPAIGPGMGGAPHHRALKLAELAASLGLLWSHEIVKGRSVVIPVGSLEDHPAAPAQFDTLLALLAASTASADAECLVAPPIGYGFSPRHRWNISLHPEMLTNIVREIARSFLKSGARLVVVVDGHYGHKNLVRMVAYSVGAKYCNIWEPIIEAFRAKSFESQLALENAIAGKLLRGAWPRELGPALECVKNCARLVRVKPRFALRFAISPCYSSRILREGIPGNVAGRTRLALWTPIQKFFMVGI